MDRIVHLDRSGWSDEARARLAAFEAQKAAHKALQAARAAHPLARTLDDVGEASWAASEAPRVHLRARDFGNGHRECLLMVRKPGNAFDVLERAIDRDVRAPRAKRGEGDRAASIESAVRRARQGVRLKAKAMAVNSLWTLTYRENVTDRRIVRRHIKSFVQAVRRVLGDWRYIAVLEKQERGAYHVHLATHALPARIQHRGHSLKSWNLLRSMWRSIVGPLGGNFDEAKAERRWRKRATKVGASKIASYLSGYVAKDFAGSPLNVQRYSSSEDIALPAVLAEQFSGDRITAHLLELAYAAVGDCITGAWFDRERGVFFIESDDSTPVRSAPS